MTDRSSGLRLPVDLAIGPGAAVEQAISTKWDTIQEIEEQVIARGFPDKTKPKDDCPELTGDLLTTPDSRHYTDMYVLLLAWFNYSNELLAQARARIIQYKNMRDILAAEGRRVVRKQLADDPDPKKKKLTVQEFEDKMLLNPEYQHVLFELQKTEQMEITMTARVESIERSLRVISRQVEIRRLDLEQARNEHNMPGRGQERPALYGPFMGGNFPRRLGPGR